jgi:hypothetical protein
VTAPTATAPLPLPSVRTLAAAAALAVAVSGRGDVLLLGGLLALAVAERRSSIAVLVAMAAVAVRWGTTSETIITGATSTFGPGIRVGPPAAAAAIGLAALAVVLAAIGVPMLPRLAAAVTATTIVIGPVGASTAGAIVLGALAVALGVGLAMLLPRWMPEPSERLRAGAPVVAAVALALAAVW